MLLAVLDLLFFPWSCGNVSPLYNLSRVPGSHVCFSTQSSLKARNELASCDVSTSWKLSQRNSRSLHRIESTKELPIFVDSKFFNCGISKLCSGTEPLQRRLSLLLKASSGSFALRSSEHIASEIFLFLCCIEISENCPEIKCFKCNIQLKNLAYWVIIGTIAIWSKDIRVVKHAVVFPFFGIL